MWVRLITKRAGGRGIEADRRGGLTLSSEQCLVTRDWQVPIVRRARSARCAWIRVDCVVRARERWTLALVVRTGFCGTAFLDGRFLWNSVKY